MNPLRQKRNPKDYTIHMIGNAHIDPVWLWRVEEGREEVRSTCRSALDRMQETPGFTFSRSSAATYQWLEEDAPEIFEEIRTRVREGRWNIVSGWWEQADCNIPCGESYIRQALYGKRYFLEKFGVEVKVGYNVDSFGHHGMLPQLLKRCGLEYYVFCRPGPHEKELPSLFWWEGPDGSRVLACRPRHIYASEGGGIEARIREVYEEIPPELRDGICFYGVGNHGGGPTKRNIESILACDADPSYPNVRFSTPERFFEVVLQQCTDFPVVRDDLQHHAPGCYTVVSEVKRENRRAECLLTGAEKFAAVAMALAKQPYPQAEFSGGWETLLFTQFHDILAGTCIPGAYDDVMEMLRQTFRRAERGLENALRAIGARVNTEGDGHALLVFNPLSWEREEVVEASIALPDIPKSLVVKDDSGEDVPVQQIGLVDATRQGTIVKMAFGARVPALGYRLYRLATDGETRECGSPLETCADSLENELYRVTFDPSVGCISSIYDKENDVEVLNGRGNLPIVLQDESDTWGHGVSIFRDELGCLVSNGRLELVESGPVRATMRVTSTFGDSSIVQDVMMYPGVRRIDCRMTVDWHERHRMLKLSIPVKVKSPVATYEIPYGSIQRPAGGVEESGQRWIDVTGKTENKAGEEITYGVSLLNDSKYGFDIKGSELRMSVVRSPIYAFHEPRQPVRGVTYRYTDQGQQTLLYAILPHAGENWVAQTVRGGHALNNPLIQTVEGVHPGPLGGANAFLEAGPDNVVATVLKKAEDSDHLVLRLCETAGEDSVAVIRCPYLGASASVPIGHYEIKTLRMLSWDGGCLQLCETDMLERAEPR